jgi:hypothetical protein
LLYTITLRLTWVWLADAVSTVLRPEGNCSSKRPSLSVTAL